MRRITLWITITLAATALLFAYQANIDAGGGKTGEPGVENTTGDTDVRPGDTTPGDGEHIDKPGEAK